MSFGDHIEELRRRLISAVIGVAVGVGLTAFFINEIVDFLVRPYRLALRAGHFPDTFQYITPAETVITYLSVAIQAGLVVASPWVIYQLWLFVASGLYKRERSIVYKWLGPSIVLFLSGVAFFFFIVLPLTLNFFVGFTHGTAGPAPTPSWFEAKFLVNDNTGLNISDFPAGSAVRPLQIPIVRTDPPAPATTQPATQPMLDLWYNVAEKKVKGRIGNETIGFMTSVQDSLFMPLPRLDDYLSFVTFMGLVFGISFEMPIVILVLSQIGLVKPATFRKIRKYAYFGIAIIAAVATPTPDIVTMMALALPLAALYEIGVLAATISAGKRDAVAAAEAEEPEQVR